MNRAQSDEPCDQLLGVLILRQRGGDQRVERGAGGEARRDPGRVDRAQPGGDAGPLRDAARDQLAAADRQAREGPVGDRGGVGRAVGEEQAVDALPRCRGGRRGRAG